MAHRAGSIADEGDGCGCRSTSLGGCGPIACSCSRRSRPGSPSRTLPPPTGSRHCTPSASSWWPWPSRTFIARPRAGGRDGTPPLWQAALRVPEGTSLLPCNWLALERAGVHVASLSRSSCSHKVLGDRCGRCCSPPTWSIRCSRRGRRSPTAATSYDTLPAFERVQPFGRLAHNGQINTIRRLRLELPGLGAQPLRGASDTQDLDLLVGVLLDRGLALDEVLAMLLPPVQPRGPLDRCHRAVRGLLGAGPGRADPPQWGAGRGCRRQAGSRLLWQAANALVSCGCRPSRACRTSASSTTTPSCPASGR